jgi:hypothetical protein
MIMKPKPPAAIGPVRVRLLEDTLKYVMRTGTPTLYADR